YGVLGVSIKPAAGGTNVVTFTQVTPFCSGFTLPAGGTVTVTNFVTIVSGAMPAGPAITAQLKYGAANLITLSNATYTAANSNLVWTGTLSSNITVPSGQVLDLVISNAQSGVSFRVDYDSAGKPSKVSLPTTSTIHVDSLGAYDAPYPGGNLVSTPVAGAMLYVRAVVSDPFGSYDITSVNLAIDGPGTGGDLNINLTNTSVVADNGCTKTYEYSWNTGPTTGNYSLTATANEGSEGITDVAAASVTLS